MTVEEVSGESSENIFHALGGCSLDLVLICILELNCCMKAACMLMTCDRVLRSQNGLGWKGP